jgi:hypothetical protein
MADRREVSVDLITRLKDQGLKDLRKQSSSSEKALAALGKKLAAVFSVTALAKFTKDSIKAFTADEKAAKTLSKTLDNLGLAFDDIRVKSFISDLERASGISDDSLRPAFQNLIRTTGSVTKSQELLTLALDVSAGSSVDLVTVAQDLSRAYVGNTRGLKKYNLGLTDAELKGKKFTQVQDLLNKQFSGQNAARLDTYEGKLAVLRVGFDNFKETIGKSLVDALSNATGEQGVGGLVKSLEDAGRQIANVIGFIDLLTFKLNNIPGDGEDLFNFFKPSNLPVIGAYIDLIDKYMEARKIEPKPFTDPMSVTGALDYYDKIERARKKAEEDAAKRAAELQKKLEQAEKKAAANRKRTAEIERLRNAITYKFDIDAINQQAALRRNLSKSDQDRLLQLIALKVSDYQTDEEAIKTLEAATTGKYTKEMAAEQMLQLLKLAGFAADKKAIEELDKLNPDIIFKDNLDDIIAKLTALINGKYTINIGVNMPIPKIPDAPYVPLARNVPRGIGGVGSGGTGGGLIPINPKGPGFTFVPKGIGPEAFEKPGMVDLEFDNKLTNPQLNFVDVGDGVFETKTTTGGGLLTFDTFDATPFSRAGRGGNVTVNVNAAGSIISQNDLVAAVTDAVYQTQRTGNAIILSEV